jgi:hypothetical protein
LKKCIFLGMVSNQGQIPGLVLSPRYQRTSIQNVSYLGENCGREIGERWTDERYNDISRAHFLKMCSNQQIQKLVLHKKTELKMSITRDIFLTFCFEYKLLSNARNSKFEYDYFHPVEIKKYCKVKLARQIPEGCRPFYRFLNHKRKKDKMVRFLSNFMNLTEACGSTLATT